MESWFKVERSVFSNDIITYDPEYFTVYCYLLSRAAFAPRQTFFKGEPVTLKIGQLITNRKEIASKTKVNEYKVQKILKNFEKARLIAQQTTSKNRLITVLDKDSDENCAQQTAQQSHTNSTCNSQQNHTNGTCPPQQQHTYIRNNNNYNKSNNYNYARTEKQSSNDEPSYDTDLFAQKALNLKELRKQLRN